MVNVFAFDPPRHQAHATSQSDYHTSSLHNPSIPTHYHLQTLAFALPYRYTSTYCLAHQMLMPYYLSPPSSTQTDNNASPLKSVPVYGSLANYQRIHPICSHC